MNMEKISKMKNQNIQNRTHGSETQHLENEVVSKEYFEDAITHDMLA